MKLGFCRMMMIHGHFGPIPYYPAAGPRLSGPEKTLLFDRQWLVVYLGVWDLGRVRPPVRTVAFELVFGADAV